MKYDVFLSYRRKGGFETAKHLFDLLSKDGYRVCLDLDTLREGDFDKALLSRIDDCQDFILIVDAHAFDRCVDPDYDPRKDWLRQELAYALSRGKNIIPVLLAGAGFPDNLPPDISQVEYKHGPSYSLEYFDSFYDKLKEFLHTKRNQIRRIWLITIFIVLLLTGTILYFVFSSNRKDSAPAPTDKSVGNPIEIIQQPVAPEQKSSPAPTETVKPVEVIKEKETVSPAAVPAVQINRNTSGNNTDAGKVGSKGNNSVGEKQQSYSQTVTGKANGYEYVDLGLSVMWATCNVGASGPTDSGLYLSWGEVSAKTEYTWTSYRFLSGGTNKDNARFSKYNFDSSSGTADGLFNLTTADDAASSILSGNWRMPTKEEFEELISLCTWKWTSVDGVAGYVVSSKKTGLEKNCIFLPAAGYYQKTSVLNRGARGCYWSSSIGSYSHSACYLGFNSSQHRTYNEERYIGRNVRPVYKK